MGVEVIRFVKSSVRSLNSCKTPRGALDDQRIGHPVFHSRGRLTLVSKMPQNVSRFAAIGLTVATM